MSLHEDAPIVIDVAELSEGRREAYWQKSAEFEKRAEDLEAEQERIVIERWRLKGEIKAASERVARIIADMEARLGVLDSKEAALVDKRAALDRERFGG